MTGTIHYILNAPMPHKKAYGIQCAKMCEAFVRQGIRVVLVCPPSDSSDVSLKDFYKLNTDIEVVRVPALNRYNEGKVLFIVSTITFMVSSFAYLLKEKWKGHLERTYTVDMDAISFTLLPLLGVPCFVEIHGRKFNSFLARLFFKRVRGIITVNPHVAEELSQVFGISRERIIVETNGVDDSWLAFDKTRNEARAQLSRPVSERIVTFIGRFYSWKGLDILPKALALTPEITCYIIGGSKEEFQRATGIDEIPDNIHFPGEIENHEVPVWLAASDALVVVWPKQQDPFYRNMSPMKIYEYMALRRPVVGANDTAITDSAPGGEMILYEPGDEKDLASKLCLALDGGSKVDQIVEHAYKLAAQHALSARAARIEELMSIRTRK